MNYNKTLKLIDCTFSTRIYVQSYRNIFFDVTTPTSLDFDTFYFMSVGTIDFGNYNKINMTNLFQVSTGNISLGNVASLDVGYFLLSTVNLDSSQDIVFKPIDFCASNFAATESNRVVNVILQNDSYDSSDCFSVAIRNLSIDLNGYTISGDGGASDDGFI